LKKFFKKSFLKTSCLELHLVRHVVVGQREGGGQVLLVQSLLALRDRGHHGLVDQGLLGLAGLKGCGKISGYDGVQSGSNHI